MRTKTPLYYHSGYPRLGFASLLYNSNPPNYLSRQLNSCHRHVSNLSLWGCVYLHPHPPSPPYVKVNHGEKDTDRHAIYYRAFFKVIPQVTSDLGGWALLSSAVTIGRYSSAISLCKTWGEEGGDGTMTEPVNRKTAVIQYWTFVCIGHMETAYQYSALLRCQHSFAWMFFSCLSKWDRNRYANNLADGRPIAVLEGQLLLLH